MIKHDCNLNLTNNYSTLETKEGKTQERISLQMLLRTPANATAKAAIAPVK